MSQYQFTQAVDYINQNYFGVLSRLKDDEIERLEQNLLLGESFKNLLPISSETSLQSLLLLALALDPYLGELRLLQKSAGIMYNEYQTKNEVENNADWDLAQIELNKYLESK